MDEKASDLDTFFLTSKEDFEKKILAVVSDEEIISILKDKECLHPLLAQLSFKACTQGNKASHQYERALASAVSIELAHNASIAHKGIIDKDKDWSGKPVFHIKEDVDNAILVGHKMLAFGFNIALTSGEEIAKLYVDTWNKILTGELKEIDFNKKYINKNLNEIMTKTKILSEYDKIIDLKTASLFSFACKVAAICASSSEGLSKLLADYGREVGFAYQLTDDLIGLEKGEKIVNIVIPILAWLENKAIDNDFLKLKNIRKNIDKNSLKIRQIYIENIKQHVNNAEKLSNSEIIPSSPYKDLLAKAPVYIINKELKEIDVEI